MKHLDKSNKWWRPWNIPVVKCSSEIYTNIHSHGGAVDGEYGQLGSCQMQSGLRWGGKCKGSPTNISLVLWYARIKCQHQIGFLTFTKKEWGNERVTSPGPALPSEARLFIFMLTCNCLLWEPWACASCSNSKWKGSLTKWPACPQGGKTTNSFTRML